MLAAKSPARSSSLRLWRSSAVSEERNASLRRAATLPWARDCSMATAAWLTNSPRVAVLGAVGRGAFPVQELQYPYDLLVIEQRYAEDGTWCVSNALGYVRGLARIFSRVRDGHRLAAHGHEPRNAVPKRDT